MLRNSSDHGGVSQIKFPSRFRSEKERNGDTLIESDDK